MEAALTLDGPSFLFGMGAAVVAFILYQIIRNSGLEFIGRKRLSFITKHGVRIYEMGMGDKVDFALPPKAQYDKAEDLLLEYATQGPNAFSPEIIKKVLRSLVIIYRSYPFPSSHPDSKHKYMLGEFIAPSFIHMATAPAVSKSSYVHEIMHRIAEVIFADSGVEHPSDPEHSRRELWALEGLVNEELKKYFPLVRG